MVFCLGLNKTRVVQIFTAKMFVCLLPYNIQMELLQAYFSIILKNMLLV